MPVVEKELGRQLVGLGARQRRDERDASAQHEHGTGGRADGCARAPASLEVEDVGGCHQRVPGPILGGRYSAGCTASGSVNASTRARARLCSCVIANMGGRLYWLPAAPPAAGYTRPACSFAACWPTTAPGPTARRTTPRPRWSRRRSRWTFARRRS